MTRRMWIVLGTLVIALALGVGTLAWRFPGIRKPRVIESLGAETLHTARVRCPIPLPDTARNIQYIMWSYGSSTQAFVRFDAPVSDCLTHAETLMAPHRDQQDASVTATNVVEDAPPLCILDPTEVDLSWFDLASFSGGVVFGVADSRAPMVWVDTNRGRFYYEAKNAPCDRHRQ